MAMNKKEQAEFEALKKQVAINRALRWTDPVDRDLPPPAMGGVSQGYDFNSYNKTVFQVWSKSTSHGNGVYSNLTRSASQNGLHLFSTEERALRALRAAVELEAAKALADIDAAIAKLTNPE